MANIQDLNALFKEVYASKVESLVPEGINLLNDIPFSEALKLGDKYVYPIMTKGETGFTINNSSGAFELRSPEPAQYTKAVVDTYNIVLQSAMSYEQAARTLAKKETVEIGTARTLAEMKKAMMRRQESMCFYGGELPSFLGSGGTGVPEDTNSKLSLIHI